MFIEVLSDGERCDGSRVVVNDNSDDGKLSILNHTTLYSYLTVYMVFIARWKFSPLILPMHVIG